VVEESRKEKGKKKRRDSLRKIMNAPLEANKTTRETTKAFKEKRGKKRG